MKAQFYKTLRYVVAGATGAGINFLIYFILLRFLNVWYVLASIVSFTLSLFAGFYLQKHFTFRNFSSHNIKNQMVQYYAFSVLNLVINVAILAFLVEIVMMGKVISKVITLIIISLWSYFIYQKIIFKNP